VPLHEVLRENLRRLELRRLLVRAPDALTVLLEQIDDAESQRVVRTDDGEGNLVLLCEREQLRQILGADADAFDRRLILRKSLFSDTRVAGRAPHARDVRRLRQLPHQSVLTSARTDDQNIHSRGIEAGVDSGGEALLLELLTP
jgi:hypothetical protein